MAEETLKLVRMRDAFGSQAPRRVALFTGAYNHIADGVSRTLNRLVSYLGRHDTDVLVFAPTVDDPPVDHSGTLIPIPSVPFPGRPEYRISLGLPRSARRTLAAFRPNLIHIATPDFLGYRALQLAERWNIPAVASYHTHFSSYLKYYGYQVLEDAMWKYLAGFYGRCRHVYVPSASMEEVLRSHGIGDGLRLWTRGVDTNLFDPSRRSYEWRRSIGVSDEEVLVTFVGRLVWEKGLRVFVEVVEGLRERGIPHRSMIVGAGPAFGELVEKLPETIFTGYLEGSSLARAYASSDVFLFPSDTETFGNVTLEAMASGLPAVCADATGSRTLVEHGESGLLVPPGNARAFQEAGVHLLEDARLRRQMGSRALQRAYKYDWDAVLKKMVNYYDEVLSVEKVASGDGFARASAFLREDSSTPYLVN
ncbi:MAG: glycosyltransferase family 1 protein [Rhodothermales bacterium]